MTLLHKPSDQRHRHGARTSSRTVGPWLKGGCRPRRAPTWPVVARRAPRQNFCYVGPSMLPAHGFACTPTWPKGALPTSSCLGVDWPCSSTDVSGTDVLGTGEERRGPARTLNYGRPKCDVTRSVTRGRPLWRNNWAGESSEYGSATYAQIPPGSPQASLSRRPWGPYAGLSVAGDGVSSVTRTRTLGRTSGMCFSGGSQSNE